MLQKMGWGEGKGLGKNEDGMSVHIKIKKRADHVGACSVAEEGADAWREQDFDAPSPRRRGRR